MPEVKAPPVEPSLAKRSDRLYIRLDPLNKRMILGAATASKKTVSDFVLDCVAGKVQLAPIKKRKYHFNYKSFYQALEENR